MSAALSPLPRKQVLAQLGLPKSTYYDWCRRRQGRAEGLEDRPSGPRAPWNKLHPEEEQAVLALARASPDLSPRELALRITDAGGFLVSKSTCYRLLKQNGLVKPSEAVGFKAGKEYHRKTSRPNEMWATDGAYLKVMGWGYYYLVTELAELIEGLKANYPKLRDAEERLAKQIRGAEERLEALRRGYGAIEERETQNRLNNRKTQIEGELLQTAPAEIDAFVVQMQREWEAIRARGLTATPARRDQWGEMQLGESNASSVRACMEGFRDAQRQAESLKLAVLTPDELRKRLDGLRVGVPAVERS